MHPVLFRLGRFELNSYGVMLALSFLLGIYWAAHRAKRRGLERNHVMDLSLFIVVSAIIGSRLMYVVTHLEEFRGHWMDTFNPFQSSGKIGIAGTTMLGGVLLALITVILFCWIKKVSFLKIADVMAPSFALGIFLTRIGCFLAGCCFGRACNLPWGVEFPVGSIPFSVPELQGAHIHPTQLYSSLYGLVIMLILVVLDRRPRFNGFLLCVFFMLYGISRFSVDFVRYYETSQTFSFAGATLTFNQGISLLMFLAGFGLFLYLRVRPASHNQLNQ